MTKNFLSIIRSLTHCERILGFTTNVYQSLFSYRGLRELLPSLCRHISVVSNNKTLLINMKGENLLIQYFCLWTKLLSVT